MPSTKEVSNEFRRHHRAISKAKDLGRNANIPDDEESKAYRAAAIAELREAKRRGGGMVRVEVKAKRNK